MAEITRERCGQIVRKVYEILLPHPEGLPVREVLERAAAGLSLTDFERSHYPGRPNDRRFEKILRFSTITSVKAGWLTKSRGRWALTEEGRRAYSKFKDPLEFNREAARLYKEWSKTQPDEQSAEVEEEFETPGATIAVEEAGEAAWTEIEAHLARMNPYDFQELVAGLLKGMGYHVSWIAPVGPDKGIDVVAHRDPLGVDGGRIKVQVKRRADRVAVTEVRSFLAVLGDTDVGLFVATGGFTSDAEFEARGQERRRLMLLDAEGLFELWVEHYAQIPEKQRRLMPLRVIHFLAPSEE